MSAVELGVIGAGRAGRMHVENILGHVPRIHIAALADPTLDDPAGDSRRWARELGIETQVRPAEAIFEDPAIAAVAIFASTGSHAELVERGIAAGKHVFCEKPVAVDPEQIDRLEAMAGAASIQVMVGLNRRFDPSFIRVRDAVARGDVGQVHIVRITNRDPARPDPAFASSSGGLFMDFTVHDFDMARFASGRDILEVSAFGAAMLDTTATGDIDTAIVTVRLEGGALGVIDNSREAVYGYDQRVEVFGSAGSAEADNARPTTTRLRSAKGVVSDRPWKDFATRYRAAYIAEMAAFAASVAAGHPVPVGLGDVAKAVRAARAAEKSLAEGRPIPVC